MLETDTLPVSTHGDRAGEADVTDLAGEVILDRSIAPGETLTGEKAINGNTGGAVGSEELDLVNGIRTLDTTSFLDDHRINLVEVAPKNFTKSEPVGRENEIERLKTDTDIGGAGVRIHNGTVSATRLNERNVAAGRGDNVPEQFGIVFILADRDLLGEVGIEGRETHAAHENGHNIAGHLRIGTEQTIKMIIFRHGTAPSSYANHLRIHDATRHNTIRFWLNKSISNEYLTYINPSRFSIRRREADRCHRLFRTCT